MCDGGGGGYSAKDAARDREAARQEAEAQRIAAENQAQTTANAATATRKRRVAINSALGAGAAAVTPQPVTTLGGGARDKSTLPAALDALVNKGPLSRMLRRRPYNVGG